MKKRFTVYVEEDVWKDIQDTARMESVRERKTISVGDYLVGLYMGLYRINRIPGDGMKPAQPEKFESHKLKPAEVKKIDSPESKKVIITDTKKRIQALTAKPFKGGYSKEKQVGKKGKK